MTKIRSAAPISSSTSDPGAGNAGGYLVAQGKPADIEATAASLTGQYLSGAAKIAIPEKRRGPKRQSDSDSRAQARTI